MCEGCAETPDTICGNTVTLRYKLITISKKSDGSSDFTKPLRDHQGNKEGQFQVNV